MTPADRTRLERYARRTFAEKATAPPHAAELVDERPRLKDGRLRDVRLDLEERLDWDLINDGMDPRGAQYRKAHEDEINYYLTHFAIPARDAAAEASRANDLKATAERLGLDPAKFASADWRQANAQLIAAADERARDREAAAELAAKLDRPLPAEVE